MSEPNLRGPNSTAPSVVPASAGAARSSVVCGTDFSAPAGEAVEAAAALACRLKEPLILVHAMDRAAGEGIPESLHDSLCLFQRAQLHGELERLQAAGTEVVEDFHTGKPDTVLVEAVLERSARLLVVSSHGRKLFGRWVLGSVAERAAEASPVPTLVVRSAAPFLAWLCGKRPLRVLVGVDGSAQSEAALRWVGWLSQMGPCKTVAVCLMPSCGGDGPMAGCSSQAGAGMMARMLQGHVRSVRRQVRASLGAARVRLEAGWGHSDAHLIEVAREEQADLVVVGTHQRHGLARFGHCSVSRGVLHYAPMSVACVPLEEPWDSGADENYLH